MVTGMKIVSKTASVNRVKIETTVEGHGQITAITTNLTLKTLMIQAAYIQSHFKIITIREEIIRTTDSNNSRCQAISGIPLPLRCKILEN
jgi:hypothetical protein